MPQRLSPYRARIIEKTAKAWDLRKRGFSYDAIAQQLDCSMTAARRHVLVALEAHQSELRTNVAEHVALQHARLLEGVQLCLDVIARAAAGDAKIRDGLDATGKLALLEERISKLLGLEVQRVEITTRVDQVPLHEKVAALLADPELGPALEAEVLRRRGLIVEAIEAHGEETGLASTD